MGGRSVEGFGPYIRRLREAQGRSQADVADAVGLSRPYLSQLEAKPDALPSPAIRRNLARELGTTNVSLLIAAGQLSPDEVKPQAAPPFDRDDPRAHIVADLRHLTDTEALVYLAETLSLLLWAQRARKGTPLE